MLYFIVFYSEFFANRAAALQIKARVERYERGEGGKSRAGGNRPGKGAYPAPSAYDADRGRHDYDDVAGTYAAVYDEHDSSLSFSSIIGIVLY